MKLPFVCLSCAFASMDDGVPAYPAFVEVRDDGRYVFTCTQGHRTVTVLQQQKFELLYEIGAYAILDGYYREAVASFASSLERFYEFFVKAKLFEDQVPENTIAEFWTQVASQSERQLGAFVCLYTQTFKRAPTLLSNSRISFRNEVIHKGKIPTRDEAVAYGQAVLDVMRPILADAKREFPQGVQRTVLQHLATASQLGSAEPQATIGMPTIVSLTVADVGHDHRSLAEALEQLRWWRARW